MRCAQFFNPTLSDKLENDLKKFLNERLINSDIADMVQLFDENTSVINGDFYVDEFNKLIQMHFQKNRKIFEQKKHFTNVPQELIKFQTNEIILIKLLIFMKDPENEILYILIPELTHVLNHLENYNTGITKLSELEVIITFIIYNFELIKPKIKEEIYQLHSVYNFNKIYDSKHIKYFALSSKLLIIHFFANFNHDKGNTLKNLLLSSYLFYLNAIKKVFFANFLNYSLFSSIVCKQYNFAVNFKNKKKETGFLLINICIL